MRRSGTVFSCGLRALSKVSAFSSRAAFICWSPPPFSPPPRSVVPWPISVPGTPFSTGSAGSFDFYDFLLEVGFLVAPAPLPRISSCSTPAELFLGQAPLSPHFFLLILELSDVAPDRTSLQKERWSLERFLLFLLFFTLSSRFWSHFRQSPW